MIERIIKIIPWMMGIIIFLNVLFLDFWSLEKNSLPQIVLDTAKKEEVAINCSSCQEYVASEVSKFLPASEKTTTPTPTPKITVTPTPTKTPTASLKVMYIPIGMSGTTTNTDWTDIAGSDFYFNLSDFPQIKSVKWETSLQAFVTTTSVYGRLYDVTNKRAVDNSELTTALTTYDPLRSGDLTIWNGNNLYRVQIKGTNGNTVNLSSPKLKLIFN